jgi:hypothetical protein
MNNSNLTWNKTGTELFQEKKCSKPSKSINRLNIKQKTYKMTPHPAFFELRTLWLTDQRRRFPAMDGKSDGYFACPKFTDKTANGLTRCIITFIRLNGWQAERINTMGRQIKAKSGRMVYIKTTGSKGSADISAVINGLAVKIEVKIGRDRQSDKQQQYQQAVESAGGVYYIAHNYQAFREWINQFNPKTPKS